jgi:glycosyltransferase involved in cell wall biosynthesis
LALRGYTAVVRVSVVIPVKDDERVFRAVDSVLAATGEAAVEVLVIDNGSAPELVERLGGLAPPARLLQEPIPGSDRARLRGFKEASGEAIFCIDADCVAWPGWVAAGLEGLASGADVVQGFSGSMGHSRGERLVQARYEAHFRLLRRGDAVETDTRNLAFRRAVLESLDYPASPMRTGDTEFGLLAEQAGFRVAYWPAMRVDHEHDPRLAVFVAKQVVHGWGAQRIMRRYPGAPWHGGHLRLMAWWTRRGLRLPGAAIVGRGCARLAVLGARGLDAAGGRVPWRLAAWALAGLDKLAGLGGHLMYDPRRPEPAASDFLPRPLARD